jgi:hypothetical protein
MDPNQTILDLLGAISCNDHESARDAAAELAAWLDRGGFLPNALAAGAASRAFDGARRFTGKDAGRDYAAAAAVLAPPPTRSDDPTADEAERRNAEARRIAPGLFPKAPTT